MLVDGGDVDNDDVDDVEVGGVNATSSDDDDSNASNGVSKSCPIRLIISSLTRKKQATKKKQNKFEIVFNELV